VVWLVPAVRNDPSTVKASKTMKQALCAAFVLLSTLLAAFSLKTARAESPPSSAEPGQAKLISREQAAETAMEQRGGKVLDTKLERPETGPPFYRVKLLSKGQVHIVRVNAITGKAIASTDSSPD
jgi:uncharacterized membrane protein YkoI